MRGRRTVFFGRIALVALAALAAVRSYGIIEVSNVTAKAIEDGKVEVLYDIENTDGRDIWVTLEATNNDEYWVELVLVEGDVGDGVRQGYYRRIVWDAKEEWPAELFPYIRVRVRADDGQPEVPLESPDGFSFISRGSFGMGSSEAEQQLALTSAESIDPSDEERHLVLIAQSFFLGQTEVSFAEWTETRAWALENGYTDLAVGQSGGLNSNPDTHPVTMISWYDAVKWLNAKSERDRLDPCYLIDGEPYRVGVEVPNCDFEANGYRLPTESEWEYACRAGSSDAFYTGDMTHPDSQPLDPNLDRAAWYAGNTNDSNTRPVGDLSKEANDFGLLDLHGNVVEWCWDWYGPYKRPAMIDPVGASSGESRVSRGGSFADGAAYCRSAYRGKTVPDLSSDRVGFRIARSANE